MAAKSTNANLIRKSYPRIRISSVKGEPYYLVDARRQGTKGKREHYKIRKEAEIRAAEIAAEFNANGVDGLAVPAALRESALRCSKILDGYGKTLDDATDFFRSYLEREKAKADSATVSALAKLWQESKKSSARKTLRTGTLRNIDETANTLTKIWGERRILEITNQDVGKYIDGINASARRKYNVCSLIGQFFNWCIKEKHTDLNPAKEIEIEIEANEPAILSIAESERLIHLVETDFRDLGRYVAICLFAGLRPTEAKLLKFDLIHLTEKQITVQGQTSKVKESRNVNIEDTLAWWLAEFADEPCHESYIVRQKNFRPRLEKLRVAAGYKLAGANENATGWVEDILRHTFASFWLAKYKERGKLAEEMGTSLKMIKQHYKNVVKTSDCNRFWGIKPTKIKELETKKSEEAKLKSSKRIAKIKRRFYNPAS